MTAAERIIDRLLADTEQQPRADALRNMRRLVDAAREAIAEVGVDVTSHEIARRAGVGVGTFYRRMPSHQALLEAVLLDTIEEMLSLARGALKDTDPWHGFRTFAAEYVRLRVTSCGVNEALGSVGSPNLQPRLRQLRELIRRMVKRAQAAEAMRQDLSWQDVAFLLSSAMPDQQTIGLKAAQDQWERNLNVLFDGLAART